MRWTRWVLLVLVVAAAAGGGFALGRTTASSGGDGEQALAHLDASELQATYHVSVVKLRQAAPRRWVLKLANGKCVAIDLDRFYIEGKTRFRGISSVSCAES